MDAINGEGVVLLSSKPSESDKSFIARVKTFIAEEHLEDVEFVDFQKVIYSKIRDVKALRKFLSTSKSTVLSDLLRGLIETAEENTDIENVGEAALKSTPTADERLIADRKRFEEMQAAGQKRYEAELKASTERAAAMLEAAKLKAEKAAEMLATMKTPEEAEEDRQTIMKKVGKVVNFIPHGEKDKVAGEIRGATIDRKGSCAMYRLLRLDTGKTVHVRFGNETLKNDAKASKALKLQRIEEAEAAKIQAAVDRRAKQIHNIEANKEKLEKLENGLEGMKVRAKAGLQRVVDAKDSIVDLKAMIAEFEKRSK